MEKADKGLDKFGPSELPPNICLEDIREARQKNREAKEKAREERRSDAHTQENMLRQARKNIIAKVDDAIKNDYGCITWTPHVDLSMEKRLELVKELLERFRVLGSRTGQDALYADDDDFDPRRRLVDLDQFHPDAKPYKSFTVYLQ